MERTLAHYATMLQRDFAAYAARQLHEAGLSMGSLFFVLYVGKHPGCTPAELTGALHVDWGYSQRSVAKLVDEGFMTKQKIAGMGRSYRLDLTERGTRAFDLAHRTFYDWDAMRLDGLDADERSQLFDLLAKIVPSRQAGTSCPHP